MISFHVRDANNWSISFNATRSDQLTLRYLCSRVQQEHPLAPPQSQCRLIWGGRVLEHDDQVREAFQPTAEPQLYSLYLVVSALSTGETQGEARKEESSIRNETPQIRGPVAQPQSPPIIRFDERSQDAAIRYILEESGRQLPGSPPNPHVMELNTSFLSILGSERGRQSNSPNTPTAPVLTSTREYSSLAERSSTISDEDSGREAIPRHMEAVDASANAEDNDNDNENDDHNNRNINNHDDNYNDGGVGGGGGNRRQVRWLDFRVLTRLAIGFALLSQGGGGPECFFFVSLGIVYYLYETGILEELLSRYFHEDMEMEVGAGTNNDDRDSHANDGNAGGEGENRGGLRQRMNRYCYSLYREGFPVPQAPGLFLDTLSLLMALCASLKPGWDPRPVNPNFFRGQPAPAEPDVAAQPVMA